MDFSKEFGQAAKQLNADFLRAKRLSTHPGLKGDTSESILKLFLKEYLPQNLEISSGHVFDTNGNRSLQLDLIIHDRDKTPVLFLDKEHRNKLIPVECVYSIIEVKSYLDKRTLTRQASGVFKNLESVKSLEKKAFYPIGQVHNPTQNYGQEWLDWPINYFVFSFSSIRLEALQRYIHDYHTTNNLSAEKRLDMVTVLGKGLILNRHSDGKFSACPDQDSTLVHTYTTKELLLFYTLVSHFLLQATMRNFRFIDYIRGTSFD